MNSNQILVILSIVVALAATIVPDVMPYWPLALIVLGLVNGVMNPLADAAMRMAYTVAAIAIPTLANGLDAIPVAGVYLNTVIDNKKWTPFVGQCYKCLPLVYAAFLAAFS